METSIETDEFVNNATFNLSDADKQLLLRDPRSQTPHTWNEIKDAISKQNVLI